MAVTLDDAVRIVRRAIDQIELSITVDATDDVMATDSDICEFAQSLFSDDYILDQFVDALRYVAVRVSSVYLPGLVTPVDPALPATWVDHLRLIEESVGIGDRRAIRKSYRSHNDHSLSGRNASDSFPVYAYEDDDLTIYGDTENGINADADVLATPMNPTQCPEVLLDAVVARTVMLLAPSYPEVAQTAVRYKLARELMDSSLAGLALVANRTANPPRNDQG